MGEKKITMKRSIKERKLVLQTKDSTISMIVPVRYRDDTSGKRTKENANSTKKIAENYGG